MNSETSRECNKINISLQHHSVKIILNYGRNAKIYQFGPKIIWQSCKIIKNVNTEYLCQHHDKLISFLGTIKYFMITLHGNPQKNIYGLVLGRQVTVYIVAV